jgi:AraC-like DNA-binding protein
LIINDGRLYDTLSELSSFIELPDTRRVRDIFIQLCELYGSAMPESDLLIHSLLLELVYHLRKYSHGSKEKNYLKSSNREIIESTIEYINDNLTDDLSLEALSAKVNFTPTYFHKMFKVSAGKNLREYIEDRRIKRSIQLMTSTDMTLTRIAYECGFSSQSYFSYAFRRKMGLPPREYVNSILKKYGE